MALLEQALRPEAETRELDLLPIAVFLQSILSKSLSKKFQYRMAIILIEMNFLKY